MDKYTLSVLVENSAGVLSRVVGLFTRRGFNIHSLSVGPTADDIEDKEGVNTTAEGLASLYEKSELSVRNIPYRDVITSFAGLRAHEDGNDFVIGESEDAKGFINAAGIESPGLSSAPAIGEMIAGITKEILSLTEKDEFIEFVKSRRKRAKPV